MSIFGPYPTRFEKFCMSLIMAFSCLGGVVLAADSRSTTLDAAGKIDTITDDSIKLLPVRGDMGVLTHGIREIGFNGISALSEAFPRRDESRMERIIHRAQEIFIEVDRAWGAAHPAFRRSQGDVGFLLVGFDVLKGRYRMFCFSSPGYLSRHINKPYAIEGKWPVTRDLAQRLFKCNLSVLAVCALALFFIRATADTDPSVGGHPQLAILSPSHGYMKLNQDREETTAFHSERLYRQYREVYLPRYCSQQPG